MTETKDPREALRAADLPTQAAGARDLGLMGTWDDLEQLLELAASAKRVGLRLNCAAAAADIAHRYRAGRGGPPPTAAARRAALDLALRADPAKNPNAPLVLAAMPDPIALDRLGRLLRDPRNTVRRSATFAIRRLAFSHAAIGDEGLADGLRAWVTDPRVAPDARADLARLIVEIGLDPLYDLLDGLGASPAEREASSSAWSLRVARRDPALFQGVWASDGLDVLEPGAPAAAPTLLFVSAGTASVAFGPCRAAEVVDGRLWIGPAPAPAGPDSDPDPKGGGREGDAEAPLSPPLTLRWILAPRLGEVEPGPALQAPGRTFVAVTSADAVTDALRHGALRLGPEHLPAARALVAAAERVEGAAGARLVTVARLLTGEHAAVVDALQAALETKKPRSEDVLWLARARDLSGERAEAIAAYRDYLGRSGRKPWGVAVAEERLAALQAEPS
jgi:hypothetical protein